jgi:hypothetical protein
MMRMMEDDSYTVLKQAQSIGTKHIASAQAEMQQGGTNRPEIVMANPERDRPSKRTVYRLLSLQWETSGNV